MKKKILYTASTSGHLSAFHIPYLEWFTAHGWEVHTAAKGPAPEYEGFGKHFDIPFEKKISAPMNFLQAERLMKIIRNEGYSLVVTNTSLAAYFTRMAVKMAGKGDTRVVNIVHGYLFDDDTPVPKRLMLLGAEKMVADVTDTVLTMNRKDLDIAKHNRLCKEEVVHINGMGVDFSRFTVASETEKEAARASLGIPENAFVLTYAAEFSPRKNQAFIICAMERLPDDIFLLLPGHGDFLARCKELAARIGVEARVLFPGYVSDIERCYHAADVCVSASRIEGLPFNIMEGMSCGLPVVASAVKGHEDLVEDGVNGYLYPFGDEETFRNQVLWLYNNNIIMNEMGENARQMSDSYSLTQVMPDVLGAISGEKIIAYSATSK